MNFFERYLSFWVLICIVLGIALGQWFPVVFQAIGSLELARINLPVGLLIWVMIIPMLVKVDFGSLHQVRRHVRGIGVTLLVNWLVKPFSMALLAWLFIRHWFAPWLPADQIDSYVAGLILLAAAPCTAMVFVWSRLTGGDPLFTLSQVALNDTIMVFAFAPIVGLLLGISSITVPWDTLFTSVVLYIVIPVIVAQWLRRSLLARGQAAFDGVLARVGPWSIGALLATLVLLFAFQGEAILRQPLVIAMLAVPILLNGRRPVAAVNTSGYSGRVTPEQLVEERLPALRACATRLAEALLRYPALRHSLEFDLQEFGPADPQG